MDYNQVKAIYKCLNREDVKSREGIARIFEQGGHLWATNGYIALDICEVTSEYENKCMTLDSIKEWLKLHSKRDCLTLDDFIENDKGSPLMTQLVDDQFAPALDPWFDIDLLKVCADFLGVNYVRLLQAKRHSNLMRVMPCDLNGMPILYKSMECKAYIMRVAKRG